MTNKEKKAIIEEVEAYLSLNEEIDGIAIEEICEQLDSGHNIKITEEIEKEIERLLNDEK